MLFFPMLFLIVFVAVFLTTVVLVFAFFDGDLSAISFFAFLASLFFVPIFKEGLFFVGIAVGLCFFLAGSDSTGLSPTEKCGSSKSIPKTTDKSVSSIIRPLFLAVFPSSFFVLSVTVCFLR